MKYTRLASLAIIGLIVTSFSPIVYGPTVKVATVLYDSGDPTPAEQLVLEYINRARADPIVEGQRLGIDIHEGLQDSGIVGPRPPLAMNKILLGTAHSHSKEMYNLNYFSHNDPNGTSPFERMTLGGYNFWQASENIAVGTDTSATALEDLLMVDAGTPGRSHRVNILDINPYPACSNPPCIYSDAGVGYYEEGTPNSYGNGFITEDFGVTPNTGPFLLGVIYDDRNGNNFYDMGEGIAGLAITPSSGPYYAISSTSGGYAFPIGTSGTITVTVSGPGLGPIAKTITLTGTNIKLDFVIQKSLTSIGQTLTSVTQTSLSSINFLSIPSSFIGATTPGAISACGSTFTSNHSSSSCASSFTATANLPVPSTNWQFDHWAWAGGVSCSSGYINPTSCSSTSLSGLLVAIYGARVTFLTNPTSLALISWGSCSNPGYGNGDSIFSTSYGLVTACYIPSGYKVSSWSCSGGLACSGSGNSTMVTFTGPGTITLNLENRTLTNSTSTMLTVTTSSSTSTYLTPEFGVTQTVMASSILVAIFLIFIRRKTVRK